MHERKAPPHTNVNPPIDDFLATVMLVFLPKNILQ